MQLYHLILPTFVIRCNNCSCTLSILLYFPPKILIFNICRNPFLNRLKVYKYFLHSKTNHHIGIKGKVTQTNLKENILVAMTTNKYISNAIGNKNITLLNWLLNGTLFDFAAASLQNILVANFDTKMLEESLLVAINLFQQQITKN